LDARPEGLRTLETTDLIPVDLNSLLFHAERTIAALRHSAAGRGRGRARQFARAAEDRRRALLDAAYDPPRGSSTTFAGDGSARDGPALLGRGRAAVFGLATREQVAPSRRGSSASS